VYEIIDGVHRSLTAWHLGHRTILALLAKDVEEVDEEVEVSLSEIKSPRYSDNISYVSLCDCLRLRASLQNQPEWDSRSLLAPESVIWGHLAGHAAVLHGLRARSSGLNGASDDFEDSL
jgi:hypothetical protein